MKGRQTWILIAAPLFVIAVFFAGAYVGRRSNSVPSPITEERLREINEQTMKRFEQRLDSIELYQRSAVSALSFLPKSDEIIHNHYTKHVHEAETIRSLPDSGQYLLYKRNVAKFRERGEGYYTNFERRGR